MTTIKLLTNRTNFSKLDLSLLDWDLEMDDNPYDIYRIDKFYHCTGGEKTIGVPIR